MRKVGLENLTLTGQRDRGKTEGNEFVWMDGREWTKRDGKERNLA